MSFSALVCSRARTGCHHCISVVAPATVDRIRPSRRGSVFASFSSPFTPRNPRSMKQGRRSAVVLPISGRRRHCQFLLRSSRSHSPESEAAAGAFLTSPPSSKHLWASRTARD